MNAIAQQYVALRERTMQQITKDIRYWIAFLNTAGNNYKYKFDDQIMIYLQAPKATACADKLTWERLSRSVPQKATGIFLLRQEKRYMVYDVSETGGMEKVPIWHYAKGNRELVQQRLLEKFRIQRFESRVEETIIAVSKELACNWWKDYKENITIAVIDSMLDELSEDDLRLRYCTTLASSVAYVVYVRCGLSPKTYFSVDDFQFLREFNTKSAITMLGAAIHDCAEILLRQIAFVIKSTIKSTLKKPDKKPLDVVVNVEPVDTMGNLPNEKIGKVTQELLDEQPISTQIHIQETILPQNYVITDDNLGEGGAKLKYVRNVAAIRTLFALEEENRTPTSEEQEILANYVGWGGLADAFDPNKPAWAQEYANLKNLLPEREYEAARASTLNAHFTSPTVIRAIYDAVGRMGFETGNILEPSMGVGNFFGMLPPEMRNSQLYGVELDSITGRIAQKLYPKADITVAGFETTNRRDFFDLAVGNVPFGNFKVADKLYDKLGFSIHNYFFAKALDQVRPGGVVAFVTSRYTMDSKNMDARKYIAQRAELLGAIRLPNNAFKANAGTEVVSDIIFLQKRDHPIDIVPDWVHLNTTPDGFTMNSYFVEHPDMVLGELSMESTQYGKEDLTVRPREGVELSELLREAVTHIEGTYTPVELMEDMESQEKEPITIPASPDVKNFSYTVVDGEVYFRENSVMRLVELNDKAKERVCGMVELCRIVGELMEYQLEDYPDEAIAQKQQELSEAYDSFTASNGLINNKANEKAFSDDSAYYLLCSLENVDEDGNLKSKADMFTKRTIRPERRVTSVDTPAEALAVCIGERGKVDLPFMAQLMGTEDTAKIAADLRGVIFRIPEPLSEGSTPRYVTADEYLSGNVREKLRQAQMAVQTSEEYRPNVEALEKAQPKDLDASEIDVRLGATWIDARYIQQFMQETFETPYYLRRSIEVKFSDITAEWRISGKSSPSHNDVAAYMTYGTDRANAYRILEETLNLKDIRIYDTIEDVDGKQKRVLNKKQTTLAQQKQQTIKDAFRDWIWKDPAVVKLWSISIMSCSTPPDPVSTTAITLYSVA